MRQHPDGHLARMVTCPTCFGESIFSPSNPSRPFCSERCKNIDLGAWANEDFRVATNTEPLDQIEDDL